MSALPEREALISAMNMYAATYPDSKHFRRVAVMLAADAQAMLSHGERAQFLADTLRELDDVKAQQVAVTQEPTQEMVTAYLTANDAYWKRTDSLPKTSPSTWRQGTPREATLESLRAALAAAPRPPQAERVPMTDEEADLFCEKALFGRISKQQFLRAVESHHGIGVKP